MNDYQQLGQPLTQEQIDLDKAANASAQFFNKANSLGHQPAMNQAKVDAWPWPTFTMVEFDGEKVKCTPLADGDVYVYERASDMPKPEKQQFDTEAHRAFMRGLG